MLIDPMSDAGRAKRGDAIACGRRKFGDACLANRSAPARPANQSFLMPDAAGTIACQILLLPGFELNELAALTEIFDRANHVLRQRRFDWHVASLDGAPVRSAGGLPVPVTCAAQVGDHRHLFL